MIDVTVKDINIPILFLIANSISVDILIGYDTLRLLKAQINLDQNIVILNYNNGQYILFIIEHKMRNVSQKLIANNMNNFNVSKVNETSHVNTKTVTNNNDTMQEKLNEIMNFKNSYELETIGHDQI